MGVSGKKPVLVYGCNGYTASLILPVLSKSGVEVIAAGRDEGRVARAAKRFGLPHRAFELRDPTGVDHGLRGVGAVLNAAGPFSRTAAPLIDGCLRARADYLDLNGELAPLQYAAQCGPWARTLGVMLLPAVGFDVVPSDCLALHVLERLPGADHLTLSIAASNLLSQGSARTFADNAGTWVRVRRAGILEPMRSRVGVRWADFGMGFRPTIAVSWGDLITAHHSTGIPNIEVYFEATAFRLAAVTANQAFAYALRAPVVRTGFESLARFMPGGPSASQRAAEFSVIVAEATHGRQRVRSRLVTPEAYTFTAEAAARALGEVLGGRREAGFQTPARLFGADFVLGFAGVTREVLE